MAFSEVELKDIQGKIDTFLGSIRPREEIRKELDYECQIIGQSLILYEVRPVWNDPKRQTEMEIAKVTYVKSSRIWKVYWMRANGKWEPYFLDSEVNNLESFFEIVRKDETAAFFG